MDFVDGTAQSTDRDTVHMYNEEGQYTVTLTVKDVSGNEKTAQTTVNVYESEADGYTQDNNYDLHPLVGSNDPDGVIGQEGRAYLQYLYKDLSSKDK